MDIQAFQHCIDTAIASLPEQIREHLCDVAIVVEETSPRGPSLLGLYQGVPLTQWGREYNGKIPDKITLYRESIEMYAQSEEEVPHVIRETLLHEIAHYLGFDHPEIRKMERKWKLKRGGDVLPKE